MTDGTYTFDPVCINVFDTEIFCINEDVALQFLTDLDETMFTELNSFNVEDAIATEHITIALTPKEAMEEFLELIKS